jgi:amidase
MDDIIFAPATTLARAIRDRRVSSVEVVEAHLRRIEAVNPRLNAVVQLSAERARDEARAADAESSSCSRRPSDKRFSVAR